MPAARSRTEHWRDCLQKIHERGGALELSVKRSKDGPIADAGSDVVWRCRIVFISDSEIHVEPPAAFGAPVMLQPGVRLIGAMTIGQNRWMFHTSALGYSGPAGPSRCLVVGMPEQVERCSRRSFFRITTADLRLPGVQCWPLIDPATASAAEAANRAQINDLMANRAGAPIDVDSPDSLLLPEVGPMFRASLLNLSGGGLGLLLTQRDASVLQSRPHVWLRLDLRPEIPAPIGVTARLAHTHLDSAQNLYAGMAFDFTHNVQHRTFIADLVSAYIQAIQDNQTMHRAA